MDASQGSHKSNFGGQTLRAHQRHAVDYQVTVKCPTWDMAQRVAAENLSKGGLFIPTTTPTPVDAMIEISLSLPDQRVLQFIARVRHVISVQDAEKTGRHPGIGVAFVTTHQNLLSLAELSRLIPQRETTSAVKPTPAVPTAIGPDAKALPRFATSPCAPVVGIDFGVTSSGISVAVGDTVFMIPASDGLTLCPSVVHFPEGQRPLVGLPARAFLATAPERTVPSVKRLLGRQYSDERVAGFLHDVAYVTSRGPNDTILVQMGQDRYAVPQIGALIVRYLKEMAEARLKRPVTRAVLAYPIAYDQAQQEALVLAARLAGVEAVALLHEPLAAALAYGYGQKKNEIVGVYDFGGGTFDFTIIDMSGEHYRVLAAEGDAWLGGDDFDQTIAEAVANGFWRQTQIELRHRAVEWQRLLLACEQAKRELTDAAQARISLPRLISTPRPLDLEQAIDRLTLQRLCLELFQRSLEVCQRALSAAGLEPSDLTEVVISGGTARIPFIRDELQTFFQRTITPSVSMDEAVALGAGVFAARIAKHPARRARSL